MTMVSFIIAKIEISLQLVCSSIRLSCSSGNLKEPSLQHSTKCFQQSIEFKQNWAVQKSLTYIFGQILTVTDNISIFERRLGVWDFTRIF